MLPRISTELLTLVGLNVPQNPKNVLNGQIPDAFPPWIQTQDGNLLVICHNKTIKSHCHMVIYCCPALKWCFAMTLVIAGFHYNSFLLICLRFVTLFVCDLYMSPILHHSQSENPVYEGSRARSIAREPHKTYGLDQSQ